MLLTLLAVLVNPHFVNQGAEVSVYLTGIANPPGKPEELTMMSVV